MEHNPNTCPNKGLIADLAVDVQRLREKFIDLDKETAVKNATLETQYKTIIEMITVSNNRYSEMVDKVGNIEKAFTLNEYKTNQNTDIISKITWSVVAKVGTLVVIVATMIMSFYKTIGG
jgi:hypothetical protein